VIAFIIAVLAYLRTEMLVDAAGHHGISALEAIRKRISSNTRRATWPWPALIVVVVGSALTFDGFRRMLSPSPPAMPGLPEVMLGPVIVMVAIIAWRNASRSDDPRELLAAIERLLRKHGYDYQADVASRLGTLTVPGREAEFQSEATGLSMWGGAGSVADVSLGYRSSHPKGTAMADERILRRQLVEFAEVLERRMIATPRTRDVASTLRRWGKKGI
jgi:hypothetical protein